MNHLGTSLTLLATLSLLATGCAQSATAPQSSLPAATQAMSSETLQPDELKRLDPMLGEWRGTGTLTMGGATKAAKLELRCSVAPGGIAMICVHRAEIEESGTLIENAMIGYDPVGGALHWYNVNTGGETHDHVGAWISERSIQWRHEVQHEGVATVESIRMDLAPDTLAFHTEVHQDGELGVVFDGKLSR